jgi:hypothetical protein
MLALKRQGWALAFAAACAGCDGNPVTAARDAVVDVQMEMGLMAGAIVRERDISPINNCSRLERSSIEDQAKAANDFFMRRYNPLLCPKESYPWAAGKVIGKRIRTAFP